MPPSVVRETAPDKQGAVTITLQTKKDDFDEKAEVKVDLANPDLVVEKILTTLAHKFPPESIVTIAANRGLSSAESSPLGRDDSSDQIRGSSFVDIPHFSAAGYFGSNGSLGVGSAPSYQRKPSRLSGRHYLGSDGEYYPEVADSRGHPIAGYVRDARTGRVLPVGREVMGADNRILPDVILGPSGKPVPGVPVPSEGLDGTGLPRPCYEALDGTHPWEAFSADGQPLPGFAVDCHDGQVKPVGPPVLGADGRPKKGVIRGPNQQPMSGIPLKPVQKLRGRTSRGISPQAGYSKRLSSQHMLQWGTYPGFQQQFGVPQLPTLVYPYPDMMGSGVGGSGSYQPLFMPQPYLQQYPPTPLSPMQIPPPPPMQPSVNQKVATQSVKKASSVVGGAGAASTGSNGIIKIPAPAYLLEGSVPAVLAVGPDGKPMDGYAHDPKTADVLPVGQGIRRSDGISIPGLIRGPGGSAVQGLVLSPQGWHEPSQQPLPSYFTRDRQWAPMYIDPERRLMHGLARDPKDGQIKPVGIQAFSEAGSPIPGTVIGPDGKTVQGIAVQPVEGATALATTSRGGSFVATNVRTGSGIAVTSHHGMVTPSAEGDSTPVRYVEVDVVEEKVVEVPGERIVKEIEKRVPKVEIVEVEKIVEIPRTEYIDKTVEVPQVEEVVREVRVKQVVDRPYDVIVKEPKIETKIVEKIVEVPGEIIEVPRVQRIENPVTVPRYNDREVPTVVAQRLQPVIRGVPQTQSVSCVVTEPKIITVDVFIPKPVGSVLNFLGKTKETHKTVDIPAAQFNSLIKRLNINLEPPHWESLLVKEGIGVPILPVGERVETVEPVASDWSQNHQPGKIHCSTATEVPSLNLVEPQHEHHLGGAMHQGERFIGTARPRRYHAKSRGFTDSDDYDYDYDDYRTRSMGESTLPSRMRHRRKTHKHHTPTHRRKNDERSVSPRRSRR